MTVEQMATGQSVEVIIAAGFGLLALIRVSERVFQARKTAWESEKAKWDAKTAQLEYEERTEAIEERPRLRLSPEEQAESLIAGLVDTLALRGNVTSIELQLEGKILRLGTSVPNERDSSKNPPT